VVASWRRAFRFKVAPASMRDQERAADEGIMAVFEQAGAQILPNACGICAGYGMPTGWARTSPAFPRRRETSRVAWGLRPRRSGSASPLTVAASAIIGRIADPREFLKDGEGAA
jgi:3-isopropylmalate/(R)-2-methylmalate dehydratase large subunit